MKKISVIAVSVLALFASCQDTVETPVNPNEVRFMTSFGSYSVRATDTQFEQYDAVSIAALSPISSGAVKYTYQNGGLSSETPICWNAGQKEATRFLLMYPYNEKIRDIDGRSSFEFCVNADQSTHAKYTASDLMYADTVATPDDPVVFFSVRHALSQVVINLENKSDKKVTDAYFSNVYGNVEFSYATGIQTTGSMGTIRACSLNASSGQSWVLIMAPQTSKPELLLTTEDGKQITFTLPESVTFRPGHKYAANVVLDETATVISFTAAIQDWTPDNMLNFQNAGSGQEELTYLGTGKIVDDIIADVFGFQHEEFDAEYYTDNAGNIIIKDPYKNASYWEWVEDFELVEGATITLVPTEDGGYYVKEGSSTGISCEGYGEFKIESYCYENGWCDNYKSQYFYTYYKGNLSAAEKSMVLIYADGQHASYTNYNGMMTFTLPGYIRYPVFWDFGSIDYNDSLSLLTVNTPLDLTQVGIAWFPYSEMNLTLGTVKTVIGGTADNMLWYDYGISGDLRISLRNPFTQTGAYRIMAAGDCTYADGEWYYGYVYRDFAYVAPGDKAPECNATVSECKVSDNDPTTISLRVHGSDIAEFYVYPVQKLVYDMWVKNGMDMYDLIRENGKCYSGYASDCAANGKTAIVEGLDYNTEYAIVVVAENLFGNSSITAAYATTGGEMTFTSLGYGMFYDNFVEYSSQVEILQESSGKPIYRVMYPYGKLLKEKPDLEEGFGYNDHASEYIEFNTHEYATGNYVFYKPIYNGVDDVEMEGALHYEHMSGDIYDDPSQYISTYCNRQTAPGVFSFAPWVYIGDTGMGYNYREILNTLVVVLPGYEWNPNDASTRVAAKAPMRSKLEKFPVKDGDRLLRK